jgi:16S rRNA G1207 methylase RsmC
MLHVNVIDVCCGKAPFGLVLLKFNSITSMFHQIHGVLNVD